MPLATFLSCMHFSYELLDFIGMATRESRHAIFVSYRLLKITAWSILSKHPLKYRYIQKVRAVTQIGYSPNGMI